MWVKALFAISFRPFDAQLLGPWDRGLLRTRRRVVVGRAWNQHFMNLLLKSDSDPGMFFGGRNTRLSIRKCPPCQTIFTFFALQHSQRRRRIFRILGEPIQNCLAVSRLKKNHIEESVIGCSMERERKS